MLQQRCQLGAVETGLADLVGAEHAVAVAAGLGSAFSSASALSSGSAGSML